MWSVWSEWWVVEPWYRTRIDGKFETLTPIQGKCGKFEKCEKKVKRTIEQGLVAVWYSGHGWWWNRGTVPELVGSLKY